MNNTFYMIVRLHRWQPKSNRYRDQIFRVGPDEQQFAMDFIFRRGAQLTMEPGSKPAIMRTQQVDRVSIIAASEESVTLDVWTSPVVERKYERKHPAAESISVRKVTARDREHMCACHHLDTDHSDSDFLVAPGVRGLCLIPGCACRTFQPLATTVIGPRKSKLAEMTKRAEIAESIARDTDATERSPRKSKVLNSASRPAGKGNGTRAEDCTHDPNTCKHLYCEFPRCNNGPGSGACTVESCNEPCAANSDYCKYHSLPIGAIGDAL